MDSNGSGQLSLNEFQDVIDNYKIPGISASDAHRLFKVFDSNNSGAISFNEFLTALCTPLTAQRRRLVTEAFQWLDSSGNGCLELNEVKGKFDPTRHPEVIAGLKTAEEARFRFFDLFTTFHNASTGFSADPYISLEEFLEYHLYLNELFDKDYEFRNFVVGVWNMDLKEIDETWAGQHVDEYGKNSREHWKKENHQVVFGKPAIVAHVVEGKPQKQRLNPALQQTAGTQSWNPSQEKGGHLVDVMSQRKRSAAQQSKGSMPFESDD